MTLGSGLPAPAELYLNLTFPEPPAERPYVVLNMVGSADGKSTVDGREVGLSSPADKLVLQAIRVHADAVLDGAGTARASGASPLIQNKVLRAERRRRGHKEPPLQVILSRYGNLPLDAPYLTRRDFRCIIFVGSEAEAHQVDQLRGTGREIETLTAGVDPVTEMLTRLRAKYRVRQVVLEGGPTLNGSFVRARALDEYFLTVSPHIVGGVALGLVAGEAFTGATMPSLALQSVLAVMETNEVYMHWRFRYDA